MSTKNNTRFLERPPLFNAVFNNDILDMLTAIDRQFGTDFAPVYWEPFRGNKMIPNPTNSNLDLPTNKQDLTPITGKLITTMETFGYMAHIQNYESSERPMKIEF